MFRLYCSTLLVLLTWDMGQVWNRFGDMGKFKGRIRCKKKWVNRVIINVSSEINYKCIYMFVIFKYKYNVKSVMYTISAVYERFIEMQVHCI